MPKGSVLNQKVAGRPRKSNENVRLQDVFFLNPKKFVRTACCQLQMPCSQVLKELRKVLNVKSYNVQRLQEIKANDKPNRMDFAVHSRLE